MSSILKRYSALDKNLIIEKKAILQKLRKTC